MDTRMTEGLCRTRCEVSDMNRCRWNARAGRVAVGCLAAAISAGLCGRAEGQAVIHAVTGTVSTANPSANTFSLKEDNGNTAMFQALGKGDKPVVMDKALESLSSSAAGIGPVGTHVLVFFYGYNSVLTAVGMEKLDGDEVTRRVGHVTDFDKHKHVIKLSDVPPGAEEVELSAKTVVDTPGGVVEGLRYHPNKGERVGVISSGGNGGTTVWLVTATGPNASL